MSIIGLDIKRRIDLNNELIEKALKPNQFTLNNTVMGLMLEIDALQAECPHEFNEGYCIYCYKSEADR